MKYRKNNSLAGFIAMAVLSMIMAATEVMPELDQVVMLRA